MAEKNPEKSPQKTKKEIQELAHGDSELILAIYSTLSFGVQFGVDVIETLKTLALPKEELRKMYAGAGRFPNIFLAAIVLREIREKRKSNDASK